MVRQSTAIRTFIGAQNFKESCAFYERLGFSPFAVNDKMIYYSVSDDLGFYLQDYYVKDWVDNSMVFLEVADVDSWHRDLIERNLMGEFDSVRLSDVTEESWGRVVYLHDPSGILWHVATCPA